MPNIITELHAHNNIVVTVASNMNTIILAHHAATVVITFPSPLDQPPPVQIIAEEHIAFATTTRIPPLPHDHHCCADRRR
jgi:hypothetical protein